MTLALIKRFIYYSLSFSKKIIIIFNLFQIILYFISKIAKVVVQFMFIFVCHQL